MAVSFYSQNTLFIDNISQFHDVFDVHWKGDEYEVFVNPLNLEDLKGICEIFVKHSSNSLEVHKNTNDFFWNGPLDDHFIDLFGEEKGSQIMDEALVYLDSLFE